MNEFTGYAVVCIDAVWGRGHYSCLCQWSAHCSLQKVIHTSKETHNHNLLMQKPTRANRWPDCRALQCFHSAPHIRPWDSAPCTANGFHMLYFQFNMIKSTSTETWQNKTNFLFLSIFRQSFIRKVLIMWMLHSPNFAFEFQCCNFEFVFFHCRHCFLFTVFVIMLYTAFA